MMIGNFCFLFFSYDANISMSMFTKLTSKQRGTLTTVISGAVGKIINLILLQMGLGQYFAFVIYAILSNLLTYTLDILFAKRIFHLAQGFAGQTPYIGSVPYHDLGTRASWLIKSLASAQFFRFVVTMIIDFIISISIIDFLKKYMDMKEIHFWGRDFMIATLVPAFTFLLFLNILRFDWAYNEKASPIMNIIVLLWVSMFILVFVLNTNVNKLQMERDT